MRRIRYNSDRREVTVTVRKSHELPHELLGILNREGLLVVKSIGVGRRRKSVTLLLMEHKGLPSHNLLERLADWLSKVPGHRAVHDPWEIGGQPVNINLAVELVVDAILGFDERKLKELTI